MNDIDQLTMDYMSNKAYHGVVTMNMEKLNTDNKKEEKFYKKRLIQLYRQLFKSDQGEEPCNDQNIEVIFHRFNKLAIDYLKQSDISFIIQKELDNDIISEKKVSFIGQEHELEQDLEQDLDLEQDQVIDRDIEAFKNKNNNKICTLDKYVIKKPINVVNKQTPPQKITMELHSTEFKYKGVKKPTKSNKLIKSNKPTKDDKLTKDDIQNNLHPSNNIHKESIE